MDRNEIRDYILDVAEVKQTLLDTTSYCNRIQDAVRYIQSCIPRENKLTENYIFDENQSVKWNRDMVIETNKRIDEKRNLRFDVESVGNELIRKALINLIVDYYNFSIKSAEIIYNNMMFIYGHCDIDVMIENLENIADVCESVIESEKNKEK